MLDTLGIHLEWEFIVNTGWICNEYSLNSTMQGIHEIRNQPHREFMLDTLGIHRERWELIVNTGRLRKEYSLNSTTQEIHAEQARNLSWILEEYPMNSSWQATPAKPAHNSSWIQFEFDYAKHVNTPEIYHEHGSIHLEHWMNTLWIPCIQPMFTIN